MEDAAWAALIFKHLEERKQLSLRQKRAEHSHEREIDELR